MLSKLKNNSILISINTILGLVLINMAIEMFNSQYLARVVRESGEVAFWLLAFTLFCTPLNKFLKTNRYKKTRKSLGVYSFLFCTLHVAAFFISKDWELSRIFNQIQFDYCLVAGFVAFILMAALALTSNKFSIRKLGRNWKKLHKSVYVIVLLSTAHVLFLDNRFQDENLIYALLFGVLLLTRVSVMKKTLEKRKQNHSPIVNRKGKTIKAEQMTFSPLLIILALLFSLAPVFVDTIADEKYKYDKNHRFYTTWFMDEELKPVTHEKTNQYCGECHDAFQPGLLPRQSWELHMDSLEDHFGEKIVLKPEDQKDIRKYLVENAAEVTESKVSVELLDSLSGKVPKRITKIPYFVKAHDEIKLKTIQHKSIQRLSNCPACHLDAEKTGNYNEKYVVMPEY